MSSWRSNLSRASRRTVYTLRAPFLFIVSMGMPLSSYCADGIATVQENGRKVYVNAVSDKEAAANRASLRARSRYVYWSSADHAWKSVPSPSPWALSAARSAASEVASYVSATPAGTGSRVSPGYRELASGHRVTSAEIDKAIEDAAGKHDVDPNLVRALIKVESNFNANAVSRKGAMGLMQLMPQTARSLNVTNPFDPQQNVDAGVRHLKQLLQTNDGNVPLTLAAYNAGQGAVARNNGIPPYQETRNYVKRITELYMGGSEPGTRMFTRSAAPIRISRDSNGVLRITNTE